MRVRDFSLFLKRYPFELTAIGVGILCMATGIFVFLTDNGGNKPSYAVETTPVVEESHPDTEETEYKAEIAGAVVKPGVYPIASTDRVEDLIKKAGGFTDQAATIDIAKELNRAAYLADTGKVYIPTWYEYQQGNHVFYTTQDTHGTVYNPSVVTQNQVNTVSKDTVMGAETIDINTATASELDALPGIGPKTAEKILSTRPFTSLEEMVSQKVISQSVADSITDSIRFGE